MSDASAAGEAPFDPAGHAAGKVGFHLRLDDHYEVGREKVREFARAVQEAHPAHYSEDAARVLGHANIVAPATFFAVVAVQAQTEFFEKVAVGYDLSQIMQTDQRISIAEPILVGDRLTVDVFFESFRQMGGSDIFVTRNVIVNQHGDTVVTSWTTLVARSGGLPDTSFLDTVKGVMMHGAAAVR